VIRIRTRYWRGRVPTAARETQAGRKEKCNRYICSDLHTRLLRITNEASRKNWTTGHLQGGGLPVVQEDKTLRELRSESIIWMNPVPNVIKV
jgi:hypothetical protein